MPSTVVGIAIAFVAFLPGALYTWSFEREAGSFGVGLADRTFRFFAVSSLLHLVLSLPAYILWRIAIEGVAEFRAGQFAVAWIGAFILMAVPLILGTVLGGLYASRGTRDPAEGETTEWARLRSRLSPEAEERLLHVALGRAPAPRAWDHLFSERPKGYLRITTPDDLLLVGKFAGKSYAGGFPQPTDLYLEEAHEVDQATGEIGDGLGYPLYVASDQIAWLEVVPQQDA